MQGTEPTPENNSFLDGLSRMDQNAAIAEAAPWAKDASFVLITSGDGQGASLHRGWEDICAAVLAVHYFNPSREEIAELFDRFLCWEDWEFLNDRPWRWSADYEDGHVSVTRITDDYKPR